MIGVALWTASIPAFLASPAYDAAKIAFTLADPIQIAEYRLTRLSPEAYEAAIQQALLEGDVEEAAQIVDIGVARNIDLDAELVAQTQETILGATYRNAGSFIDGFFTGDASDGYALAGSITSDYLLFGDLRDSVSEGTAALTGNDYNGLILALSLFGLATVVPGAGPVDVGASLMKATVRVAGSSGSFLQKFARTATGAIDQAALRRVLSGNGLSSLMKRPSTSELTQILRSLPRGATQGTDPNAWGRAISKLSPIDAAAARKAASSVFRPGSVAEIGAITTGVGKIATTAGARGAMKVVALSDDVRDLRRFQRVADGFKARTPGVLRLLGKTAILLGDLMWLVISAAITVLSWVAWGGWILFRILRSTVGLFPRPSLPV
ncbi:hypothetical protein GCM10007908_33820 [Rhizobium albus]|nr:hypothetical protein GCM10007908_33820 [Rhizobium albus]